MAPIAGTYTDLLPTHGYLTDKRTLNMAAFEEYVRLLASHESIVFEKKKMRAAGGRGGGGRYSRRDRPGRGVTSPASPPGDPLAYKREYYLHKFGLHPKDSDSRKSLVHSYLQGLCWCLAYYHDGCASWDWYYPDFYGPLATDMTDLPSYEISLELGEPFPPLAQLLSVLPPQSADLVPPAYRELMLSPNSPVFDAYPTDFSLDLNGKRAEWEAIALLPFIDERRLLGAVRAIDEKLSDKERARNVLTEDIWYKP